MPRYLIGTNCLVEIAKGTKRPPQLWLDNAVHRLIDQTDIYISAVTPMILNVAFEFQKREASDAARSLQLAQLHSNVTTLVDRFVAMSLVAPVTKEIADTWGELLPLELGFQNAKGRPDRYNFQEKLVLATAIRGINGRPFTLLERRDSAHQALESRGLVVEDPYEAPKE